MAYYKSEIVQTHHAILIGVGSHEMVNEKPLHGALADIEAVAAILDPRPYVKVTKLGIGSDGTISGQEPTWRNIRGLFRAITREDFQSPTTHVYIHFSGHGSRGSSGQDHTLLAIYDDWIPTTGLSGYLDRLIRKGIHVTLVLDCCFSGAVHRDQGDGGVRFLEYDPDFASNAVDSFQDGDTWSGAVQDDFRGAVLAADGFNTLDPKACTIITACDSHEQATERKKKDGTYMGVLTCCLVWALEDLMKKGTQIEDKSLIRHLRYQVQKAQKAHQRQTPMLYGSSENNFFTELISGSGSGIVSDFHEDGTITLDAGKAHGVHVGDEYDAVPFYAAEPADRVTSMHSVRLRVEEVDNLTSRLSRIGTSIAPIPFASTWKATLAVLSSSNKIHIHLQSSIPEADRRALLQQQGRYPYLCLDESDHHAAPNDFSVALDPQTDTYVINDATGQRVPGIPKILGRDRDALQNLSKVLGHLAKFNFFKDMDSQQADEDLELAFTVSTTQRRGEDGWYEVPHRGDWTATCVNKSDCAHLYISVFEFGSCWSIENILGRDGEFWTLSPAEERDLTLEMKLLDRDKEEEDMTIKIYVTTKPTSFQGMTLPKLDQIISGKGDSETQASNPLDKMEKWAVHCFRFRIRAG
ncbi:hypothetical protein QBC37DRAFT_443421 [Rhypophila decipiens]|uniref:Peptidase C14 caspase domain-containing protein n=1 Tax=Rhypophila decipiens TaxID=261697 RepID=A0AAN6Y4K6_9PEZI|nr:hypothetical protein QBC37DRAFT_443421 [Rhypophila decipiens]